MHHCHAECNEASRPAREILRFAQDDKRRGSQDDKRVLSMPAGFWPTFAGLLNEYVGVKGFSYVHIISLSYLNCINAISNSELLISQCVTVFRAPTVCSCENV